MPWRSCTQEERKNWKEKRTGKFDWSKTNLFTWNARRIIVDQIHALASQAHPGECVKEILRILWTVVRCCVAAMDITHRLHERKGYAVVVSIIAVVLNAIHVNMFTIGILVSSRTCILYSHGYYRKLNITVIFKYDIPTPCACRGY